MNLKKLFIAIGINLAVLGSALAGATPEQVKIFVDKAVAHVKQVGPAQAYKDFNTAGSKFFDGELFIFAYDFEGNCLALGASPQLTGKNLINMTSADGKFIIKDFIQLARTKGDGWYEDYQFMNPQTKKLSTKSAYIKRIPGQDAFVASGYHR